MKCISAINPVPGQPGRERMDLHCYNRTNPRQPNICRARCHMGVITEDPKSWQCHEYSFEFFDYGKTYYLHSHANLVDPYYQHRGWGESTELYNLGGLVYSLPYFMPISTGDDMHEEAWELFHRLKNLVAFS